VILERHRRASTIVTSNRAIDEWIPLFDEARAQRLSSGHRRRQLPQDANARATTTPSPLHPASRADPRGAERQFHLPIDDN